MRKIILFGIMFLIMVGSVARANIIDDILDFFGVGKKETQVIEMDWDNDIYTNSDGSKSLILYSGIRNVIDTDGKWKRIEEATSLKPALDYGKIKVVYLKNEEGLDFEIMDLNYTSITLKPTNIKDVSVPLKIDEKENYEISKNNNNDYGFTFTDNIFNHTFTIGKNSTTIQLQTPETYNLEDAYVVSNAPTTNYGTSTTLNEGHTDENINRWSFLKYKISTIPEGSTIDSASFTIYLFSNSLDSGEAFQLKSVRVSSQTWVEDTITWNTMPTYVDATNSTVTISNADPDGFYTWSVTNIVKTDYNLENPNCTIAIIVTTNTGSPATNDLLGFLSKEYTSVPSRQPYLNVTYSEPVTTTTTTTPATTTTTPATTTVPPDTCDSCEIDCNDDCVISDENRDCQGDLNIYSTGSGYLIINNSNITYNNFRFNATDNCYIKLIHDYPATMNQTG